MRRQAACRTARTPSASSRAGASVVSRRARSARPVTASTASAAIASVYGRDGACASVAMTVGTQRRRRCSAARRRSAPSRPRSGPVFAATAAPSDHQRLDDREAAAVDDSSRALGMGEQDAEAAGAQLVRAGDELLVGAVERDLVEDPARARRPVCDQVELTVGQVRDRERLELAAAAHVEGDPLRVERRAQRADALGQLVDVDELDVGRRDDRGRPRGDRGRRVGEALVQRRRAVVDAGEQVAMEVGVAHVLVEVPRSRPRKAPSGVRFATHGTTRQPNSSMLRNERRSGKFEEHRDAIPSTTMSTAQSATDIRLHLELLETERAAALQTVLRHDAAYMTDLREEIVATRHAYVGSAVAEIASFRAQLAAPQVG